LIKLNFDIQCRYPGKIWYNNNFTGTVAIFVLFLKNIYFFSMVFVPEWNHLLYRNLSYTRCIHKVRGQVRKTNYLYLISKHFKSFKSAKNIVSTCKFYKNTLNKSKVAIKLVQHLTHIRVRLTPFLSRTRRQCHISSKYLPSQLTHFLVSCNPLAESVPEPGFLVATTLNVHEKADKSKKRALWEICPLSRARSVFMIRTKIMIIPYIYILFELSNHF